MTSALPPDRRRVRPGDDGPGAGIRSSELCPLSPGSGPRKRLLRLRCGGPALPGFHRRNRRQRAGTRASAHPQGDPRTGRAADPLLPISTITNIRGRWPSAWRRSSGLQRTFFANTGTEAMEGAPQDGARARPRHPPREIRDHRAGEFLSRPHAGRALHHRPAQVPPAISSRCCRACDSFPPTTWRRWKRPSASARPASCWR